MRLANCACGATTKTPNATGEAVFLPSPDKSAQPGGFLFSWYNDLMALSWSGRRQSLYYAVAGVILIGILLVVWQTFFTTIPTCFDNKQNGGEFGVDCGGTCALLCQGSARAPVVLWARAFRVSGNNYTAAAYVQNNNVGSGARAVSYSFQLFDDKNILVVERDGRVDIPPVQTVPIVETGIDAGNRTVAKTIFAFSTLPTWYQVSKEAVPPIKISGQKLNQDGTLSATVTNNSLRDVKNLSVAAVLFDAQGTARAASKSRMSVLPAKASQQVIFTWPEPPANIVRAEVTVLPEF